MCNFRVTINNMLYLCLILILLMHTVWYVSSGSTSVKGLFYLLSVLQMTGLKPIGSDMSKLILEYNRLASALDTTLHIMSVNGVAFPDNHGMVSF